MQSDRELEEWIDAAIPGYSQVEPPLGLEQRILTRALAGTTRRRRFAWQWSLAIPAVACLLIFLFLHGKRNLPQRTIARQTSSDSQTKNAVKPALKSEIASGTARYARVVSARHLRTQPEKVADSQKPLPRQDIFPTPTPPTPEEEAMIAFTRLQRPISPRPADRETEVEIADVHIAELEIKPLPTLAEQKLGPSASLSAPTNQQP